MAMSLELYDNLKGEIGEKAARVIAEAIPPGDHLATQAAMERGFEQVRAEIKSGLEGLETRLMRWMLSFFVPLWLGVYGTLAAVVITLIVRS